MEYKSLIFSWNSPKVRFELDGRNHHPDQRGMELGTALSQFCGEPGWRVHTVEHFQLEGPGTMHVHALLARPRMGEKQSNTLQELPEPLLRPAA